MAKRLPDVVDSIAGRILAQLKALLGAQWKKFQESERSLLADVSRDAALIVIAGLSGEPVEGERLQIDAQLANIKSAGVQAIHALFWQAVNTAVSTGLGIAGVAIRVA